RSHQAAGLRGELAFVHSILLFVIVPAADLQAFAAANNVIDGLVPVPEALVGVVLQFHALQSERRDGPFGQVIQPVVDDLAAQEALHAVHQGGLLLLVGGIFLLGALGGGSDRKSTRLNSSHV